MKSFVQKLSEWDELNFIVTNYIPRRMLTHLVGFISAIENRWLTKIAIQVWKIFARDLDLSEAKKSEFSSLRDCFTRELKPGLRSINTDSDIAISPCDAIVGEFGDIAGNQIFQAKGSPYRLDDLVTDHQILRKYRRGRYVTLRLKSSMYHRFHSPIDGDIKQVTYISGDCWNVNPATLKRIEKLFCKNERAFFELHHPLQDSRSLLLVPVAAVLVASMKFHCLPEVLHLNYRGPNPLPCKATYRKGDELGYFLNGSTIILLAPENYVFSEQLTTGQRIFMGQELMKFKADAP